MSDCFPYLVDSHCHLNYGGLNERETDVLDNAAQAGVGCMLAINTKLSEFDDVLAIANRHHHIYASVGIHPHEAENESGVALEALIERAKHPKVIGIGETGLDYYYETAPKDLQIENFETHIKAARQQDLPVIIHTRDADDDTIDIVTRAYREDGPFKGLIHCFTATQKLADAVLDLGFSISISGIVTFKKADDLRAVVKKIPLERLLVETDSPFLAPVPYRGKTCEPAYVAETARFLADLKQVSFEELQHQTSQNFFKLFSKAKVPDHDMLNSSMSADLL